MATVGDVSGCCLNGCFGIDNFDAVSCGVHVPVLVSEVRWVDDGKVGCRRVGGRRGIAQRRSDLTAGNQAGNCQGASVDASAGKPGVQRVKVAIIAPVPLMPGSGFTAEAPWVSRNVPSPRSVHSGSSARTTSIGVSSNKGR
jgi:hypothetical protein